MPKLTKPLTREIEVGGRRIEVILAKKGIELRAVASRRRSIELTWEMVLCALTGQTSPCEIPQCDDVEAALALLQEGTMKPKDGSPNEPLPSKSSVPELSDSLARLDKWLRKNRRRYHRALFPGATDTEINALRTGLPSGLPGELETLLRWHNGQDPEVFGSFKERWLLMSTQNILDTLEDMQSDPLPGWQSSWVPFLDNDSFSYLFLDASQSTSPVRVYWDGLDDQPTEAVSLSAWMHAFVVAIENGEYTEDPERGEFLRRSK